MRWRNPPGPKDGLYRRVNFNIHPGSVQCEYFQVYNGQGSIYTFTRSKCASRAVDIPARGQVTEALAFVAIRMLNEDEI